MIKQKILVSGASGFIGAKLIEKIAQDDSFIVTALVRNTSKSDQLSAQGIHTIIADLSDKPAIEKAVEEQDIVINLAYDFKQSQKQNLRCFSNLSEACIKHGIKHFIQVSSIVVYDDWPNNDVSEESSFNKPGTDYKNTKVAIENALSLSSEQGLLHSTILQPTIVYGPYSWLWTDYVVEKLLTGTMILPGEASGQCNAVYVDDVVDALILTAKAPFPSSSEKYIISGPEPVTWKEFFEHHNQIVGKNSIQYIDVAMLTDEHSGLAGKIKTMLANPLRLANWQPVRLLLNIIQKRLGTKAIEGLKSLIKNLKKSSGPIVYYPDASEIELYCGSGICSIEKAKKRLGYTPRIDFSTGFNLTSDYIKDNLQNKH